MRDGLFKRYVTTFAVTLIVCTLLLCIALLYFSATNFSQEKLQVLINTAGRAVAIVNDKEEGIDFEKEEEISQKVIDDIKVIYETTGATVYIANTKGHVVLCSEDPNCVHTSEISPSIISVTARRGSYYKADYLEGFFLSKGNYTYGVAVYQHEILAGFIFLELPISPLFSYLSDMLVTFFVSAILMFAASMIIIFFATRRLIAPLREISGAARSFGSGDFEARVKVVGNDEIARLALSFNSMADSLTEFENTRRTFVANVSHELRTPMTTIGGYIDGILDNTIPHDQEDHYLSIASDEVKRLSRLTSSLLDITRIEEGAYTAKLTNFDVWEVIISVLANIESRIDEKKIVIPNLDAKSHYVLSDRDMLFQIIYNLIDNAIKFTPEQGALSINVSQKYNRTYIAVRNPGAGIKKSELGRIFERFYKIDKSRGLDRTGTGLGLYIAKTLAQKIGGDLVADSVVGEYAEFTVIVKTGAYEKNKAKDQKTRENGDKSQIKKAPDENNGSNNKSWLKKLIK